MKRVCIIGNSHVSMLRMASDGQDDVQLTYFAKPKLSASDLTMESGRITADNTDMQDWLDRLGTPSTLDLTAFDAVVIVAVFTSIFPAMRITQTHAITGWPSMQRLLAAKLDDKCLGRPLMTRETYLAVLEALNRHSLGYSLAAHLRRVSDVPIYAIAQPFPSALVRSMPDTYPVMNKVVKRGDGDALAADLVRSQRLSFDDIPDLRYIPQPAETIAHGCLTDMRFMRDARRLDTSQEQPDGDVMHANDQLGRHFLDDIRADLLSL